MKTTLKFFALTVALFGITNIAFAQSSATGQAAGKANILEPITISKTLDLDFGDIISQTALFTVTVTPEGVRSASNATAILTATGQAAAFTVGGAGSHSFAVTLPSTPVTIKNSADDEMTITGFSHNLGATPALSGGTASLTVGAVLNVGAAQASGQYTGNFNVTVAYN